jgi:hypothetical protein
VFFVILVPFLLFKPCLEASWFFFGIWDIFPNMLLFSSELHSVLHGFVLFPLICFGLRILIYKLVWKKIFTQYSTFLSSAKYMQSTEIFQKWSELLVQVCSQGWCQSPWLGLREIEGPLGDNGDRGGRLLIAMDIGKIWGVQPVENFSLQLADFSVISIKTVIEAKGVNDREWRWILCWIITWPDRIVLL